MKYVGRTDIGIKRKSNQDSFAIFAKGDYMCAVVCDGMGGAKGGNIASGLAVKTFSSVIKKAFSSRNADNYTEEQVKALLSDAVNAANAAIHARALRDDELDGMGTTLVACISCLCGTFAVNVGDSRLYKITEGSIKQVSTDHSFVQYLLDHGEITRQQAEHHPNKNIILRALGVNESVECDLFRIDAFDMLLLCTDGLTNHLTDDRILEIVTNSDYVGTRPPSAKARVEALIKEANHNGGSDNITAVIVINEQ